MNFASTTHAQYWIQYRFGRVVKRDKPERNPSSSITVKTRVKLRATSNLQKQCTTLDVIHNKAHLASLHQTTHWISFALYSEESFPTVMGKQAKRFPSYKQSSIYNGSLFWLLWATLEIHSCLAQHSNSAGKEIDTLTLDQYTMIFKTK